MQSERGSSTPPSGDIIVNCNCTCRKRKIQSCLSRCFLCGRDGFLLVISGRGVKQFVPKEALFLVDTHFFLAKDMHCKGEQPTYEV